MTMYIESISSSFCCGICFQNTILFKIKKHSNWNVFTIKSIKNYPFPFQIVFDNGRVNIVLNFSSLTVTQKNEVLPLCQIFWDQCLQLHLLRPQNSLFDFISNFAFYANQSNNQFFKNFH